ncbi:RIO1 family regulatory kinase/ATPase domain-containing protein [Anaeromyxobacter terrae]|uniref:RIO1 family regulatory kinase/ATPase domain-containing protein n=1 Tax=Anaeromyxobacter terrae TaxID=2925406 RepID=UPI001F57EC61|nr:RIO1 family regulatory kinase/ATPase [Anaeromyxobacter sp. SG22]
MHDPLAPLLADGVIEEVCARLKSGKEADLWLVRHGGEVVAAKVYKAREARSFRNNAGYKEGRQVRDSRMQRAMDRGSRFGQAAAEEAWKAKEADALHALHAAGVRVPRPVMFYEGVLLMELVVDANGHPAPRLVDAHVAPEEAAALYADLRSQIVRMLGCDLIHGDLSPYNILLGWNGPVVIDFPQVVGAAHNSQAESFFQRDLENVRRFFAAIDPAVRDASGDGREIWRAYVRRELSPDFVPSGRPPEPPRQGGEGTRGQGHGRGHGERHPQRSPEQSARRDRGWQERRERPPQTAQHEARAHAEPRERHDAPGAHPHPSASRPEGQHQSGPRQAYQSGPRQAQQPGPRQAQQPGPRQAHQSGPRQAQQPGPRQAQQPGPRQAQQPGPRQAQQPGPRQAQQPGPRQSQQSGPRQAQQSGPRQAQQSGPRQAQQSGPRQAQQSGPRQSQQPGRGGPDRRRNAPAPEVIRVSRPLLGPGGTPAPTQGRPAGAPPAHGPPRADGPRHHDHRRHGRRG